MKYPITFDYERDKFCDADGNKIAHSVVTSTFNDLERRLKIAEYMLITINLNARQHVCQQCQDNAELAETALKAIQEGRDDRK